MTERDNQLKKRGDFFKSIPVSDWHHILAFEKVIRNYIKMKELLTKTVPTKDMVNQNVPEIFVHWSEKQNIKK